MTLTDYGFLRAAGASVPLKVADPAYNAGIIIDTMKRAEAEGARLLVLPELCLTGYTCGDLFHQAALLEGALAALERVLAETAPLGLAAVLGLPAAFGNSLFNFAAVIQKGRVLGLVPKSFLPGYGEFYEERWFSPAAAFAPASGKVTLLGREVPAGTDIIFRDGGGGAFTFAVELCEDLWTPAPPSAGLARAGALVICNPSASNEVISKHAYRRDLVRVQSARLCAGYVYAGAGVRESTTDLVFGGASLIAENGALLAEGRRFSRKTELTVTDIDCQRLLNTRLRLTSFMENYAPACPVRYVDFDLSPAPPPAKGPALRRTVDPRPFVPASGAERDERCAEIFAIQTAGLASRLEHTGSSSAVIGVSGGLDSTLALLVTVKTFDLLGLPREGVTAVTMPGFGTTGGTRANAQALIKALGTSFLEVDIRGACEGHFRDIGQDPGLRDTAYENVQARMRTLVLMNTANRTGGLVIGTGDLSEMALGWCTYNGDHMSMYAVNAGVPKTLVKYLTAWAAEREADEAARPVLQAVLATPISPELLPPDESGAISQKTEDILGPYEVHDFFLYHFFRYGAPPEKLLFLAKEAFPAYSDERLRAWLALFLRRFFSQQFKRSCTPDGPKVGTVSLSPRGDWRMPSDASAAAWLSRL